MRISRSRSKLEYSGGFLQSQTAKKTQLDEFRNLRFHFREGLKRLVKREKLIVRFGTTECIRIQPCANSTAPVFQATLVPCRLDHDPTHRFRRCGEEVPAALPLRGGRNALSLGSSDQPEQRLVDEGRGLQSLSRWLFRQPCRGQASQLRINQRDENLYPPSPGCSSCGVI